MSAKITLKKKNLELLQARLLEFRGLSISVGFQGPKGLELYPVAGDGPSVTVAQVAIFQEFGTQDIPARSFFRETMFQSRNAIARMAGTQIGKVARLEKGIMAAFEKIGVFSLRLIDTKIARSKSWAKPNKKSTLKSKKGTTPLIDTEKMRSSLTWAIRKDGAVIASGGLK